MGNRRRTIATITHAAKSIQSFQNNINYEGISYRDLVEERFRFESKTKSPMPYFDFIRKLAYLIGIRVYQFRDYVDGELEIQLIMVGLPYNLTLFSDVLTKVLVAVEKDLESYKIRNGHQAFATKTHLTAFMGKEKSRMLQYIINWVETKIKEYPVIPEKIKLDLYLQKYHKEKIKHKQLKKELKYKSHG